MHTTNANFQLLKRCLEARVSKSAANQRLLLEALPRLVNLATAAGNVELPLSQIIDYVLAATAKYAEAYLTYGLIAVDRPHELQLKTAKYLALVTQTLRTYDAKCV